MASLLRLKGSTAKRSWWVGLQKACDILTPVEKTTVKLYQQPMLRVKYALTLVSAVLTGLHCAGKP